MHKIEIEDFKLKIIDNSYINWLKDFQYHSFNNSHFIKNHMKDLCLNDIKNINYLEKLFNLLNEYNYKIKLTSNSFCQCLEYNNKTYVITNNTRYYACFILNLKNINSIKYNDLKQFVSCNIDLNIDLMKGIVIDSTNKTDLDSTKIKTKKV